jgi:hypothetical protein
VESSGSVRACNGTALSFSFSWFYYKEICYDARSHERRIHHVSSDHIFFRVLHQK